MLHPHKLLWRWQNRYLYPTVRFLPRGQSDMLSSTRCSAIAAPPSSSSHHPCCCRQRSVQAATLEQVLILCICQRF